MGESPNFSKDIETAPFLASGPPASSVRYTASRSPHIWRVPHADPAWSVPCRPRYGHRTLCFLKVWVVETERRYREGRRCNTQTQIQYTAMPRQAFTAVYRYVPSIGCRGAA